MKRILSTPVFFCSLLLNITSAHADWRSVGAGEVLSPLRCEYRLFDNRPATSGVWSPNKFNDYRISIDRLPGSQGVEVDLYYAVPESIKLGIADLLVDEQGQKDQINTFTSYPDGKCEIIVRAVDKGFTRLGQKNVKREYQIFCYESDMAMVPITINERKLVLQTDCGH